MAPEMQSTGGSPVSVAVAGSCITRDNFNSRFNPDYRQFYACPIHQNQTSIISLMSKPLEVEWAPTGAMSDYDRWNVETEFSKSFLVEAPTAKPDHLVLDFFGDVYFGVVQVGEGGPYVTDNRWKVRRTDWYVEQAEAGRLRTVPPLADLDAYVELWRESFERFLSWFETELPDTTLIVHRGHMTPWLRREPGERPVRLRGNHSVRKINVKKSNELWRRLDDLAIEMSGARSIDILDRPYPTYREHPWGAFYVHYEPLYYHRFLAELHRITLSQRVDATSAAMLAEMARASAESDEDRRSEAEERITALRQRVVDLEAEQARRPLRRARRAVGRVVRR